MFKQNSWGLADVLTMALLAVPLAGCGDAVGDLRHARQSRPLSNPAPQRTADADKDMAVVSNDAAASHQLSQAELRHFHVYQNYRAVTSAMDAPAMRTTDHPADDGGVQRAVLTFSSRNMNQGWGDCSQRAMLMLD